MTSPCDELPNTMQRRSHQLESPRTNQKSIVDNSEDEFKSFYHVQTKTAKKGLFGLDPTGTDADVFIRIHDENGSVSEIIQLKDSVGNGKKFSRGKLGKKKYYE